MTFASCLITWSGRLCLALALLTPIQPLALPAGPASNSQPSEESEVADPGKQAVAASNCRLGRVKRQWIISPCPLVGFPSASEVSSNITCAAIFSSTFLSRLNPPLRC